MAVPDPLKEFLSTIFELVFWIFLIGIIGWVLLENFWVP
jgi:cbb3-type cytochrome oxidase subunit 3